MLYVKGKTIKPFNMLLHSWRENLCEGENWLAYNIVLWCSNNFRGYYKIYVPIHFFRLMKLFLQKC